MAKVPEYTKRAIEKYQKSMKRVVVLMPLDMEQSIKDRYGDDVKIGTYIKELINKDLSKEA